MAERNDLPVPGPPAIHNIGDFCSIQSWNFPSVKSHSPLPLRASSAYSLYRVTFFNRAGLSKCFSRSPFCSAARLSVFASAIGHVSTCKLPPRVGLDGAEMIMKAIPTPTNAQVSKRLSKYKNLNKYRFWLSYLATKRLLRPTSCPPVPRLRALALC